MIGTKANETVRRLESISAFERLSASLQDRGSRIDEMPCIRICTGGGCIASGSLELLSAVRAELEARGLENDVPVIGTGCMGPCAGGPVVKLGPDGRSFSNVAPKDAAAVVDALMNRQPDRETGTDAGLAPVSDRFFELQTKIVLRNCGHVDPLEITDYIAHRGYLALMKVLSGMDRDAVVEEMKRSGLRGRGGAGFPTWLKWSLAKSAPGETKYLLCNADEGDPGAFMDRSILEGDPHSLIEGMLIGAYAIGASHGYVYVRAEYPLAVERLSRAIDQARAYGLLGTDILGTGFSFDLEIRKGSGAFVCGEETALIASVEGKRGEPRPRPPFPAQRGVWGCPTVLNNVETWVNVPVILDRGAAWFARHGTAKSPGTKVFALAGKIRNSGLVEVPIGTSLGELIYDIGGGIVGDKAFKAAQIGGPSGGCIPREHLSVPLDYESLTELGAIMGSGGLIVMDEDDCMVDVARFFLEFVQDESCGKCTPCRVGTKRMLETVERITSGDGRTEDLSLLAELGSRIRDTALCGLGQTAPNPVISTMRHFRSEYEDHILARHCEAGSCAALVRAPCQSGCPAGVDVPGFVSLVGEKRYAEALALHRERNPFAAVCARVCFHTCEDKCRRSTLDESVSIRAIKRYMVDQEITVQLPEVRENRENAGRRIAIVGAGPAGLSCAYFLARLGYRPTVFEAEHRPGGMLVQTIPAYRLPRETLAREIRMIERLGVDIETGRKLGRDFTLQDLKSQGYEAVFLGVGSPSGVKPALPGGEAEGVTEALEFLKQYNLRGSVPVGKNVIVVGGGNAAIDAARTALRLGAGRVLIVYRRTREEMPAYDEEIEQALEEGVELRVLTGPTEILNENGRVTGLRCQTMRLGAYDRTGRRHPESESGKGFTLQADQIIFAIGQEFRADDIGSGTDAVVTDGADGASRETGIAVSGTETLRLSGGRVKTDARTCKTSVPWIFAAGDVVTGPSSVVSAIAGGERAAVGIDLFLTGAEHAFWRTERQNDTAFDPDADPVPYPRESVPVMSIERRRNNFEEVERPWTEAVALRQAKRCLRCDYGKPNGGECR